MSPTRREFLGRTAVMASGSVGVAGCLSFGSDDDPEPVDVGGNELRAIATIDAPDVPEELPVDIADSHVERHRSRAEALLEAVPPALDDIPNEAVRRYIAEERGEARDRLAGVDDGRSNYAILSGLTRSRDQAAEAEAAYAAARGDRTREDVSDAVDPVRDRLSALERGLTRVGDVPHRAALVYNEVEDRFDRAWRTLDEIETIHPAMSEVRAVGAAASALESARATLEVTSHVLEQQTGERTFDDGFERAAEDLLADVADRTGVLPSDREDAGDELFDAEVSDTPREVIGRVLHRVGERVRTDEVRERLDRGKLASALMALYDLDHVVRTANRVQNSVAEGAYDRPEDGADIRHAKEAAVEEIASVLGGTDYPSLTRYRIGDALGFVEFADNNLDLGSEERLILATGHYALAAAQARALPSATEWFVERLP